MKKKDKFYRKNLKDGIFTTIGIIIISFIFIFTISYDMKKDLDFASTAKSTKAEIIDMKHKSYVLIKYNVNNTEYTDYLKEINSSMYIGKKINIYYNKNNPEQFIFIDYFYTIAMISFLIIMSIAGFIGTIIETKKIIRYIETLNGLEIRAKIVKVIEIQKLWWKEYKIECTGKDEAGNIHTFYSRNFREPYLDNEIKKMKLDTLKVRYKKYQPNKYIVLTESLEKNLSK